MDSQVQELFKALVSPDTETIKKAEAEWENICQNNTIQTLEVLIQCKTKALNIDHFHIFFHFTLCLDQF